MRGIQVCEGVCTQVQDQSLEDREEWGKEKGLCGQWRSLC